MSRRNKRDPFNPFAPGASAKPQKKPQKQRDNNVKTQAPVLSRQEKMAAVRKKIKEQQEKKRIADQEELNKKINAEAEEVIKAEEPSKIIEKNEDEIEEQELVPKKVEPEVKIKVKEDTEPKKSVDKPQEKSKTKEKPVKKKSEVITAKETSKLDDLKRRSDELAAKTGVELPKENFKGTLFSTKKTVSAIENKKPTPKKPVRKTKKGGGKQPKQKKLNRRKQLEFRFDARAILDNSSVAEEHRSNIFGQIWAKGERVGIDSAIEYVTQKEQEGILTEDVSNELVGLIRSYTIKR